MAHETAAGQLSELCVDTLGVFRGCDAVGRGVSRRQLATLRSAGVIERLLPDTYRMTSVRPSELQTLCAALHWAGDSAVVAGRSAGWLYGFEGVEASVPEIVVPRQIRARAPGVVVHTHTVETRGALLRREHRGFPVTGPEPTLVALAATLDAEAFEIACEDARRRRLTSVPALHGYLARHGRTRRAGIFVMRRLLAELDPVHPARSTLEVKTRRLLAGSGLTGFVRELPLEWNGRTYLYDFAFEESRTILETNGRRWHDDPADYEHDNEKWSVPGRLGYRIVFATWDKVVRHPETLLRELSATLAA